MMRIWDFRIMPGRGIARKQPLSIFPKEEGKYCQTRQNTPEKCHFPLLEGVRKVFIDKKRMLTFASIRFQTHFSSYKPQSHAAVIAAARLRRHSVAGTAAVFERSLRTKAKMMTDSTAKPITSEIQGFEVKPATR